MVYIHRDLGELGTAGAGLVVAAAANVAVNAHHAAKMARMQKRFTRNLESDQEKMDWFKLLLERFKSVAIRLATVGQRPGTLEFEKWLRKALKDDMDYKGHCNIDMYMPMKPGDTLGKPREIFATINKNGYMEKGKAPKEVGLIWAHGCKGAMDEARMAFIKRYKGQKEFEHLREHKEDLGTMNLALKFGTGFFLLIMMLILSKVQSAVVRAQAPPPRKKRKRKKRRTKKKP